MIFVNAALLVITLDISFSFYIFYGRHFLFRQVLRILNRLVRMFEDCSLSLNLVVTIFDTQ